MLLTAFLLSVLCGVLIDVIGDDQIVRPPTVAKTNQIDDYATSSLSPDWPALRHLIATTTALPMTVFRSEDSKLSPWDGLPEDDKVLATTICLDSLWNTCVGRCGSLLKGPPYACACDVDCVIFKDCCLDYVQECALEMSATSARGRDPDQFKQPQHDVDGPADSQFTCLSLSSDVSYGILMVSECPAATHVMRDDGKTITGSDHREECEKGRKNKMVPVIGDPNGLVFINKECAACNGVHHTADLPIIIECNPSSSKNAQNTMSTPQPNFVWPTDCRVPLKLEDIRSDHKYRYRICNRYDVDACPASERPGLGHSRTHHQPGNSMKRLCALYSKPLLGFSALPSAGSNHTQRQLRVYKNIHCAMCNGLEPDELSCPVWDVVMAIKPHTGEEFEEAHPSFSPGLTHVTGKKLSGFKISDLPASMSILFHFNKKGKSHMMMHASPGSQSSSSKWWEKTFITCDSEEIWDPFCDVCRPIYCTAEFTLVNFRCVDDFGQSKEGDSKEEYATLAAGNESHVAMIDNVTLGAIEMEDMDLSSVLVVLLVQLDCCLTDAVITIMESELLDALAASLEIPESRFTNLTIYNETAEFGESDDADANGIRHNCHSHAWVSTVLTAPDPDAQEPEPSVEKVIASLVYSVSLDHLFLQLNDHITVKVVGLQEKIMQVSVDDNSTLGNYSERWCAHGRQLVFVNDQFTPIVQHYSPENWTLNIYVNVTGQTFLPGQFIANVLFQGGKLSQFVNVSTVAIVCEQTKQNESCVGVMVPESDYFPLPNGSILYIGNETTPAVFDPGHYEVLPDGQAILCFTLPPLPQWNSNGAARAHLYVLDYRIKSLLTTILLSFSTVALLATVAVYVCFRELRTTLPGLNTINLATCLLVFQVTFLGGMRPSVVTKSHFCKAVAILLHYSILAFFFWTNVIAYDLYRTFAGKASDLVRVVTRRTAFKRFFRYAAYAYGGPLLIVGSCVVLDQLPLLSSDVGYGIGGQCWIGNPTALAISFIGILCLILVFNAVFYVLTVRSVRSIGRDVKLTRGQQSRKSEVIIYMRMSSVMGFMWIFGFLSDIPDLPYGVYDVFVYLFDILNGMQGVFIFVAFCCNQKVVRLTGIKEWRLCSYFTCRKCKQIACQCKNRNYSRTLSNETCKSVLATTVVPEQKVKF